MVILYIVAPLLLGVAIVSVEACRKKLYGPLDVLTSINAVYFLCFVVVPPFLYWAAQALKVPDRWWALLVLDMESPLYIIAGVLVLLSYVFMIAGYFSGKVQKTEYGFVSASWLAIWGVVLLTVGAMSIVIYARQIGGFQLLLETFMEFRGQGEPIYTEFAFLKTLSVVATGSPILFFGALQVPTSRKLWLVALLALSIAVSLLVLLVNAGRLMVMQFLLAFPLFYGIKKKNISVRFIFVSLTIFFMLAVFGHGLFRLLSDSLSLQQQVTSSFIDPEATAISLLCEFAFPWTNIAMVLSSAGVDIPLRWFLDVPLAIAYLVPKRIFPVELPPTVSMVHADMLHESFPADLISFGLYSGYIPGAFIVSFAFGRMARFLENLFATDNAAILVLKAAWIAYIGSRVMYGNPHHTLFTSLPLLLATFAILRRRLAVPSTLARMQ